MASADLVRARARRAYEHSRLVDGVLSGWPVVPLLILTTALHGQFEWSAFFVAAALAAVLITATWRGRPWQRATLVGVAAGLPALLTPTVVAALQGQHCTACVATSSGALICTLACLGTSLLAGVAVGLIAARDRDALRFAGGALVAAVLTGVMACGVTGLGGSVGVIAGFALGGVPATLLVRRATAM